MIKEIIPGKSLEKINRTLMREVEDLRNKLFEANAKIEQLKEDNKQLLARLELCKCDQTVISTPPKTKKN